MWLVHTMVYYSALNRNGPPQIKNRMTTWSSNSTSGPVPQRIESRVSRRQGHTHVHSSIIHNHQEVDATHVPSTERRLDQRNVVHGASFSLTKGHCDTCYMWMSLEDIMLSEINPQQRRIPCESPAVRYPVWSALETEVERWSRGPEGGEWA